MDDTDTEESRWEAVDGLLRVVSESEASSGTVRLIFGNETFIFELNLVLDSGEAFLDIARKPDAAFG